MSIGQRHGETNTGKKRRRNEDAFVCEAPLFAVADGMGGAQAGEVASAIATAVLAGALKEGDQVTPLAAELLVRRLIQEANRLVHERATHDAGAAGMGTTMTLAVVAGNDVVAIGHVGDSRAYLLRDGRLEQLTDDHSLVAELVRRGELSPAEAEVHPQRSVITRALGTDADVDVDTFIAEGKPGDVFLLCSDGLSTMVDHETVTAVINRNRSDLTAATRALIDAANSVGGDDNITAVLFEIVAPGEAPSEVEPPVPTADDEDTLHPEDGVRLPEGWSPPAPPIELEPEADTMVLSVADLANRLESTQPRRPWGRMFLSSLVIIGLVALILVLALWGLAR